MSLKSTIAYAYAKIVKRKIDRAAKNAIIEQEKVFKSLLKNGKKTAFGKDHNFNTITNYEQFKKQVPVRDYEQISSYINKIKEGELNMLWPGKPIYLCKTSGTTSGAKYIPITRESIHNHIKTARRALLNYIAESQNTDFVNGKMIFLQGSPVLETINSIKTGRLSGIVAHHVPKYLLKNRMPSYRANTIKDWEEKVDAIVQETQNQNMTLISGIPPWVKMYFEKLLEKTNKSSIKELFPNFSLFVYGGVNFRPYKNTFKRLIGRDVDSIELFPASEGFMAFQDKLNQPGLLLVINEGIFYEFIPAEQIHEDPPTRISLKDVKLGVKYAIILNTNAGLWGYNIGDMVEFVSLNPYRIVVAGRTKHFTSAFGEHVIAEEVEGAIAKVCEKHQCEITDFHVAPQLENPNGLPYHEWLIDFSNPPKNIKQFEQHLDQIMCSKNPYYADLIKGKILQPLSITLVKGNSFKNYMKQEGKLGGQNKLPRLANNRAIADKLTKNI